MTSRYLQFATLLRRRCPRVFCTGALSVMTFAFVSAANPQAPAVPNLATPDAPIGVVQTTNPALVPANPMDEPIRLITEAKNAIADVKDYSCILITKEKMGDKEPVENVMSMKVRAEPFSVDLKWLEPKALAGQEVCYIAGKYEGKMRAKSNGLLSALGFVTLDPNDARAKASSRHAITESGLANMIERFVVAWEKERRLNVAKVRIGDFEYNKRRCTRVETVQRENPGNTFLFQRTVVYFDRETHLPIRVECYAWPQKEGAAGELVEVFSYINVKLNVDLSDAVFDH
jgi:hypothetical protein